MSSPDADRLPGLGSREPIEVESPHKVSGEADANTGSHSVGMVASAPMPKGDRDALRSLTRQGARILKSGIEAEQAKLLADLEEQLAGEYKANDPHWEEITKAADAAVRAADREIAERCEELGVRPEFRPSLSLSWYSRGQNAEASRRAELRKVAQTRIAALGKAAKLAIDTAALERETALVAGGLSSDEARLYLESMPTLAELMPPLSVAELEAEVPLRADRR